MSEPAADQPMVSVAMITYKHEKLIAQAIESVLMQERTFGLELVIGEDCSPDGTRQIVQQYAERWPNVVRPLLPEKNMGMHANFQAVLAACRGKYVAILEGDDYWTSPHKLEKQVAFLEAHPDFSLCFHNVEAFHDDGRKAPYALCPPSQKETSTIEDLLYADFVPTCSIVFPRALFSGFPGWIVELGQSDWVLEVILASRGKVGYLNEMMARYRLHAGGVWSGLSRITRNEEVLRFYDRINLFLDRKFEPIIRRLRAELQYELACLYGDQGDRAKARRYTIAFLREAQLWKGGKLIPATRLLLRNYMPALFDTLKAIAGPWRERKSNES